MYFKHFLKSSSREKTQVLVRWPSSSSMGCCFSQQWIQNWMAAAVRRCILKSLLASRTSNNIQFSQAHAAALALTLGEELLHTQVPRGRGLTGAAGDWRDWQAAEKQVHGGQQGLQETDGAESRASMWGKVDFIGIGAGWLKERLILTAGAEGKEEKKGVTERSRGQLSD